MAMPFFNSWALWEKMTFVLALAILAVFCIGYGKLAWKNRLVKKRELGDEEKRMRIQELISSGQIIESRKSHDIPFGVRAIQSGIQIDGIWISKNSTPVPSNFKLGHVGGSSSDLTATSIPITGTKAAVDTSKLALRPPSRGQPPLRQDESVGLSIDRFDRVAGTEGVAGIETHTAGAGHCSSYKPRKYSHLRFGSRGETQYDIETLEQLEGKPPVKSKIYTHRPNVTRRRSQEVESSSDALADNEHSSGLSSDSDVTLSNIKKVHADPNRQSLSPHILARDSNPKLSPTAVASSTREISLEDKSAPLFATLETTPNVAPPVVDPLNLHNVWEVSASAESYAPVLSQSRPASPNRRPFVPGELHINKTVRKVNSGFEVLPAGTFGVPAEFRAKALDHEECNEDEDCGEKRHSNKLQKKVRTSINLTRPSNTMDRP